MQKNKKKKAPSKKAPTKKSTVKGKKKEFPKEFPFWARFKVGKKRTTLIIDEDAISSKNGGKSVEVYVHREATHTENHNYEKIYPNPDRTDLKPMYLKRPTKKPKKQFEPHNKDLDMPEHLKKRYEKNNKKK